MSAVGMICLYWQLLLGIVWGEVLIMERGLGYCARDGILDNVLLV